MASGFTVNSLIDELGEKISLLDGQLTEVEYLVKVDDDHTGDDLDVKFIRDDVRHVCSYENAVRLTYLERRLTNVSCRLADLRRRNAWVREDVEEPEAKVGAVVAEDEGEARKEIKDGLRARD